LPGVRIFNEDIEDITTCAWYEFWCTPSVGRRVANVDFASQINVKNGYHHPKMDTLVMQLVGGTDDVEYVYHMCSSGESAVEGYQWWPEASLPGSVIQTNHELLKHYETRLDKVPSSLQEPTLDLISVPHCLTHDSFDEIKNCLINYSAMSYLQRDGVAKLGWEAVAYASIDDTSDMDQLYVLVNDVEPSRRKCIISFQSSDSVSDLMTFAFASNDETTYCGRPGVHTGVSNELRRITRASQWSSDIVPALETCYDVTCVGHSLGGALCNLFTICANHGSENLDGSDDADNWDDYNTLIWKKPS
jgi:hypothetical protein